jgi:hypothetical protein
MRCLLTIFLNFRTREFMLLAAANASFWFPGARVTAVTDGGQRLARTKAAETAALPGLCNVSLQPASSIFRFSISFELGMNPLGGRWIKFRSAKKEKRSE